MLNPKQIARHLARLARMCKAIEDRSRVHALKSLALAAGVHPRTASRYIEFLRNEMAAPIVWIDAEHRYQLMGRWTFVGALRRFIENA
jgi:predicted DNA-binding transcriptional regulator YafY